MYRVKQIRDMLVLQRLIPKKENQIIYINIGDVGVREEKRQTNI